jgi:ribosome-binding factor A
MQEIKKQRINDEIQNTLSALLRGIKDPRVNQGLLSVTAVETTGDLKFCKVYLSVFGGGEVDEKKLKQGLRSASGFLRRELAASTKLRNTPELIFELDKSIEHGALINSIIAAPGFLPDNNTEEGENESESD